MKKFLTITLLLSSALAFSQENIFTENAIFKYLISYETDHFKTYDTITILATGKMWKQAPKSQKEIIINYDLDKIDRAHFINLQTIGWVNSDTTGAVENESTCWIHPPRHNQFRILELAPFPRVDFPLKTGNTFSQILFIGDGWGNSSNSKVNWEYEVKNYKQESWFISAEAHSSAYPDDVNHLEFIFNEKEGFTSMIYTFSNGIVIEMERIE